MTENLELFLSILFGVLLYLIQLGLFHRKHSNIVAIFEFILACIPIIGGLVEIILFFMRACSGVLPEGTESIYIILEPEVRDMKINRWLFNNLNWKHYDHMNNQQIINE